MLDYSRVRPSLCGCTQLSKPQLSPQHVPFWYIFLIFYTLPSILPHPGLWFSSSLFIYPSIHPSLSSSLRVFLSLLLFLTMEDNKKKLKGLQRSGVKRKKTFVSPAVGMQAEPVSPVRKHETVCANSHFQIPYHGVICLIFSLLSFFFFFLNGS